MFNTLTRLQSLEADVCYRTAPPAGELEYTFMPGRLPVLISAPHGAAHTRNGKIKVADEYTAGFARLVAERTGAGVLYTHHQSSTDPNYYRHAPYKEYLERLIKTTDVRFVLDIHGASPRRDFGIGLGTMCGQTCSPKQRELIIGTLTSHGFKENGHRLHRLDRLDLDITFPGGLKQHTVTHFVSQTLGVPAAQFELNAYLRTFKPVSDERGRIFKGDPPRIYRAVNAFVALVEVIVRDCFLAGEQSSRGAGSSKPVL
jgi:hypothetical protein